MHPEDERHTSFRTPFGVYCYTVMPFGLKNAGATYQRAMMKIFQDMQHKTVECYVDDLAVKSKRKEDHLQDLREVFLRLRKHKLRMNPLKCFFGVSSGKFLGFIVRKAGIELDPIKVKAILEMPSPRTLRELKGLQGRLAYIRRFISNLSGKCRCRDPGPSFPQSGPRDGYVHPTMINPQVSAVRIPKNEHVTISHEQ